MTFLSVISCRFLERRFKGAMNAAVTFPPDCRGRAPGGYNEAGEREEPGRREELGSGVAVCRMFGLDGKRCMPLMMIVSTAQRK